MPDSFIAKVNNWGLRSKQDRAARKLESLNRQKEKFDWDNNESEDNEMIEDEVIYPEIPAEYHPFSVVVFVYYYYCHDGIPSHMDPQPAYPKIVKYNLPQHSVTWCTHHPFLVQSTSNTGRPFLCPSSTNDGLPNDNSFFLLDQFYGICYWYIIVAAAAA
jgi:hypothetical protein